MTDIFFNSQSKVAAQLDAAFNFGRVVEGMSMVLGTGITGMFSGRLPSGPWAAPSLPSFVNVTAGTWMQGATGTPSFQPAQQWSAQMEGQGKASIDLGDGYSLDIDESSSEVVITNADTGETTRIWGDPHVSVDGKHVYDFWGTTTFTLENGTKITINTEAAANNPNVYYAEKLTITKGDQAIVVDGVSELTKGDLSVSMSNNGEFLDAVTRDGFVLEENATGSGWRSELSGNVATQADLDLTRPGALYGPGSITPSFGELTQAFSAYLFFGFVDGMVESVTDAASPYARPNASLALAFSAEA